MTAVAVSDAELLARFHAERCEASFEELVRRHGSLVLGTARRILENSAEADDVAQATFIALALRSDRLKADKGLAAWLHVVATRIALDMRRSALRRSRRETSIFPLRESRSNEMLEHLDEAIRTLPDRMRSTIVAHYFQGLSIAEIADAHHENSGAVSMRLVRARELLRKRLNASQGAAIVALLSSTEARSTVSSPFTKTAARNASCVLSAAEVAEPSLVALFKLARHALRPAFAEIVRPLAASALLVTLAVPLLTTAISPIPASNPGSSPEARRIVHPSTEPDSGVVTSPTPSADPPLIAAVKKYTRFEQAVLFFRVLDQSSNIAEIRDARGRNALHWAVITGQEDFTAILLKRGANPDSIDDRGWTPLMYAANQHATWLMLDLILAGAKVDHVALDGRTALALAIQSGDARDAEILLWANADPIPPGVPDQWQPATLAASRGPALQQLVSDYIAMRKTPQANSPPALPAFVRNPLHEAAARGDFPTLATLVPRTGPDIRDEQGRTPLFNAIRAGQPEVVFYLLMMGADANAVDDSGATPLDATMYWLGGGLDSMRYFLFIKGANPTAMRKDGHSQLTWAALRDNGPGVQFLLWLKVDPWQRTSHGTAFEVAAKDGNRRILDLLRLYGIDEPIPEDGDPNSRLRLAAKLGDLNAIQAALDAGAEINSPDENGNPAVMLAVYKRNVPAARLLLQRGASVNTINPKNGVSLLISTTGWDYGEMSDFREEILKAGADVNYAKPSDGRTALMAATWHNPTFPLKQLIKHGANLNARDAKGRSVLQRAIDAGNLETAEYLRGLGARE
jgi:RNA polymerase sigma factor (sigma-70 family)